MDIMARRTLLVTDANPQSRLDYVITLKGRVGDATGIPGGPGPVAVTLRFVPDRVILATGAFGPYLGALGEGPWESLERLAATVLEDVGNELVARWAEVTATVMDRGDGKPSGHSVFLEDRQPRWDNPHLLGRLGRQE